MTNESNKNADIFNDDPHEYDPEQADFTDYPPEDRRVVRGGVFVWVLLCMALILALPYVFNALDYA